MPPTVVLVSQTETAISAIQDTVGPMVTKWPKTTPVTPVPKERMATNTRPPVVTPWKTVIITRDWLSDRMGKST